MNWKTKANILALLSRCPFGSKAYHRLQKLTNSNRLDFDESLRRTAELVDLVRQGSDSLDGKVVVEIGSGWRPFVPFILRLAGAARVITYDVNPWLDRSYAKETYLAIRAHLAQIARLCA